jgi:hypothetical protein
LPVCAVPEHERLSRDLVVARVGCFSVVLAKPVTSGIVQDEACVIQSSARAVLQVHQCADFPWSWAASRSWTCQVGRVVGSHRENIFSCSSDLRNTLVN